ncbi:hypothetical protein [Solwaraspora sp. WMMA2065]|uniref:hypothetical protein n=1 Tax=Solwaraspora sp. WMMA2065 TaxID=3015166 RepID=UPI00259BDAE6|nr:hypothetical protein [Solwaraspora sp. WMMA2065]WJK37039.1 hypothetical protein O7610_12195 [Solwaraspora sp. WMMA2065]
MIDGNQLVLTALISAVTSGVITLGIEWLAKPRLEARKEAILARQRGDAEFLRQLRALHRYLERISGFRYADDTNLWERTELRRELGRVVDAAEAAAVLMDELLVQSEYRWKDVEFQVFSHNLSYVMAVVRGADVSLPGYERASVRAASLLDWYTTPRWRIIRRRLCFERMRQHAVSVELQG